MHDIDDNIRCSIFQTPESTRELY